VTNKGGLFLRQKSQFRGKKGAAAIATGPQYMRGSKWKESGNHGGENPRDQRPLEAVEAVKKKMNFLTREPCEIGKRGEKGRGSRGWGPKNSSIALLLRR